METETKGAVMFATYDPDDNKLRLQSEARLDTELYSRVREAGFIWAPHQKIFIAPRWTPEREDLLIELCGDIGDESTSLEDRAAERAERFGVYSEKRESEALQARETVNAISGNIPFGQPILVGHHSERRARRDADKITNGISKAVRLWDTATYWTNRAESALKNAKRHDNAGVRHRRIKKLTSEQRGHERNAAKAQSLYNAWMSTVHELTLDRAMRLADYSPCGNIILSNGEPFYSAYSALKAGTITPMEVQSQMAARALKTITHEKRHAEHLAMRISYEKTLLGEQGGSRADKYDYAIGGQIQTQYGWSVILRVNKYKGVVNSLTAPPPSNIASYCKEYKYPVELVTDYKAPTAEHVTLAKKATKANPLCNYPGDGFIEMSKVEWAKKAHYGMNIIRVRATETHGEYRIREAIKEHDKSGGFSKSVYAKVYLTDQKRVDPPLKSTEPTDSTPALKTIPVFIAPKPRPQKPAKAESAAFSDMKASLKHGVKVVSAPQLFPTPPEIASKMADMANLKAGLCVLEPSAGTGNLVKAVLDRVDTEVLAYEISMELCNIITQTIPEYKCAVKQCDFLEVSDHMGCYPRIIMNPPFGNGADIRHILHAVKFLAPGGRLVALCANGPRQQKQLKSLATSWEALPQGSFATEGTGVNVAMLVIDAAK